jgi:hypothetical protein
MFCKKKNKEIGNLKTEEKIEEKDVFSFKYGAWELTKDDSGDLRLRYRDGMTICYISFERENELEKLLTLVEYFINRRKEEMNPISEGK